MDKKFIFKRCFLEIPQLDLNWVLSDISFLFFALFNVFTWQMHSQEAITFATNALELEKRRQ